ncbi:hypothetical protein STRTUCAR8_05154 [Streptomyces turgidiscabies Car8]|uniref:Uncharacterized protein n=1 Tax=Streptomyces turgidiscabies (strain Car8) TaxID=698760 RepID=L7FCH1_STRT8|nr:hypothetical protein STRTUCAR8_05154 [Streptomyces turgidiscabies Car8]
MPALAEGPGPLLAPAVHELGELALQVLEEGERLGEALPAGALRTEAVDAHAQGLSPALEDGVAVRQRLVPLVAVDPVPLTPRAGFALPRDHVHLGQVTHRAGHGGRTDLELLAEFGRGQGARVGGEQRGEDAGGHALHPRVDELGGEALDEPGHRLGVPPRRTLARTRFRHPQSLTVIHTLP